MWKLIIISFLLLVGVWGELELQRRANGDVVVMENGRALGVGYYERSLNRTGWNHLWVKNVAGDQRGCFGVGYLEGVLTADDIYFGFQNFIDDQNGKRDTLPPKVEDFITEMLEWVEEESVKGETNYWRVAKCLLAQYKGLYAGYQSVMVGDEGRQLSFGQFHVLTFMGDLEDLMVGLGEGELKEWKECTGIVRKVKDEIMVAHNTHNIYSLMLRIFKTYDLQIPGLPERKVVRFSSRPGDLNSKDDFYRVGEDLVVLQTSLAVYDKSIYSALSPQTVPKWMRTHIAHHLAGSPQEWARVFSLYNSGTHNNQWIVSSLFSGQAVYLEQMPGRIVTWQATAQLQQQGYLASYNIPFSPQIKNLSGAGNRTDIRAKIIAEHIGGVDSFEGLKKLIRKVEVDAPCSAIAPRCDLLEKGGYAFGATDGKATKMGGEIEMINGPSTGEKQLPPFSFSGVYEGATSHGQPRVYNFGWINSKEHELAYD